MAWNLKKLSHSAKIEIKLSLRGFSKILSSSGQARGSISYMRWLLQVVINSFRHIKTQNYCAIISVLHNSCDYYERHLPGLKHLLTELEACKEELQSLYEQLDGFKDYPQYGDLKARLDSLKGKIEELSKSVNHAIRAFEFNIKYNLCNCKSSFHGNARSFFNCHKIMAVFNWCQWWAYVYNQPLDKLKISGQISILPWHSTCSGFEHR